MPHTNEGLLNKPKDDELLPGTIRPFPMMTRPAQPAQRQPAQPQAQVQPQVPAQPSPVLGISGGVSPMGLGLQQPNDLTAIAGTIDQTRPSVLGPTTVTQEPIIVQKEKEPPKVVTQVPTVVQKGRELPQVITPEKQLEINEGEANIPIDVVGKNAGQIQEEIFTRAKNKLLKDTAAIDQARRDRLKQDIGQVGASGQGVGNSLLAMLNASQSAQLTNSLENLTIQQLQIENAEFQQTKAGLMNVFNGLIGDPQAQLEMGKSMAIMFPNDSFFQFIANNPNAEALMTKLGSQAFFQKKQQALSNANTIIAQIPDLTNDALVNNAFDNWKGTFFFDDDDWGVSARSWLERGDIDREELNRIHQELFGSIVPDDLTEETAKELYAKWTFEQQVKNLKTQDIKLNIIDGLVNPTDEELEIAQGMASVLANFEGQITIDALTGVFDPTALQGEGAFGIYFEDWDGIDYGLEQNSRSGRDLFNQNMDELWVAAVNSIGFENLPSREEFRTAFENTAAEFEANKRLVGKGEAAGIFKNSGLFKTKVLEPGEQVVTAGTIGFPEIPNVPRETINGILSDDRNIVGRTLENLNDIDLQNIFQNDIEGQLARQMIVNGTVPNSNDFGLNIFSESEFIDGSSDGRFSRVNPDFKIDARTASPEGFRRKNIVNGTTPKFISDGKKIYQVKLIVAGDTIKYQFIDLTTGSVVNELWSEQTRPTRGELQESVNKFNNTKQFETAETPQLLQAQVGTQQPFQLQQLPIQTAGAIQPQPLGV